MRLRMFCVPLVGMVFSAVALAAEGEEKEEEKAPAEAKEVVAVVDGEEVERAELDALLRNAPRRPASEAERAVAERQALDALINQRLMRKFIDGQEIEVLPDLLFEVKLVSHLCARADEEARALAETVKKELDGGADFAQLAKQRSACPSSRQGGDLGDFPADKMIPAFSKAVKALKVGEVSALVRTPFGYHIIERLALKDAAGEARGMLHARHILVRGGDPRDPRSLQDVLGKLVEDLRGKAKIETRLTPPKSAPQEKAPAEEDAPAEDEAP